MSAWAMFDGTMLSLASLLVDAEAKDVGDEIAPLILSDSEELEIVHRDSAATRESRRACSATRST